MKFLLALALHIFTVFIVIHLIDIVIDDQKHLLTNVLHVFTCLIFPLISFIACLLVLMREKHGYIVSLILYNVLNVIIIIAYPYIPHIG